jgi:hypothetical protein
VERDTGACSKRRVVRHDPGTLRGPIATKYNAHAQRAPHESPLQQLVRSLGQTRLQSAIQQLGAGATWAGSLRYRNVRLGIPNHYSSIWMYPFRQAPMAWKMRVLWVGRGFTWLLVAEGIWDSGVLIGSAIATTFD